MAPQSYAMRRVLPEPAQNVSGVETPDVPRARERLVEEGTLCSSTTDVAPTAGRARPPRCAKAARPRCRCVVGTFVAALAAAMGWAAWIFLHCAVADLPVFQNVSGYRQSPWATYVSLLYRNNSEPVMDVTTLTVLYAALLAQSGIRLRTSWAVCYCQKRLGVVSHWGRSAEWDPPNTLWVWNNDRAASANDSRVEVTHCASRRYYGSDNDIETKGAWFYRTPGSGVFLDIGRTRAFARHEDAVREFVHAGARCYECAEFFVAVAENATAAGVDTIQFTGHTDQDCGNAAVEIVYLRGAGSTACAGTPLLGVDGEPCRCDDTLRCASCAYGD